MAFSDKTHARIQVLSPVLIDKIAAGEVIDGPSSVIKELVENALDAGANSIRIDTKEAGIEQITIEDDGEGIHPEELSASITRHATSKIFQLEDLETLYTLGFRGEALAAIASISHLQIKSRRQNQQTGGQIICRGGKIVSEDRIDHNKGTTIRVSNLFYSTPARRKYLKSVRAENTKNNKEIIKIAITNPQTQLDYYREGKIFSSYPSKQSLSERITTIYGQKLSTHLIEIQEECENFKLYGFLSSPEYFRANRDGQYSFVNKRSAEIKSLSFIVRKAYDELLAPGMHPYYFLFIDIPPSQIDVNVHPQKKEVRLLNQSLLQGFIFNSISRILRPKAPLHLSSSKIFSFKKEKLSEKYTTPTPISTGEKKPPTSSPIEQKDDENSPDNAAFKESLPLVNNIQLYPGHIIEHNENELDSDHYKKENLSASVLSSSKSQVHPQSHPIVHPIEESVSLTSGHDVLKKANRVDSTESNVSTQKTTQKEEAPQFSFQKHFGTILGTYVLAEGNGILYIIDQHTAHERVNYEQTLEKLESMQFQRQGLLEPLVVECLSDELDAILAHSHHLKENGFWIESISPKSYVVREVPSYLDPGIELDVLVHLVHNIIEGRTKLHLYKDYAAMRACKASIKKNDCISDKILADILFALPKCKEPGRCPHGRPTMMQLSREELDKIFQRC